MSGPLSKEEWEKLRKESQANLDFVIAEVGLPKVLLPYQARTVALLESTGVHVLFIEKSRRIGETWALASYAVLRAARAKEAGGMDAMYISYNRDMTREFVDACAMWAKAYAIAAAEDQEFLFEDANPDDPADTRHIQAFRIRFASGFEIIALCSSPRTLRGKQGLVIIDEAAFVDNLKEVLKAALAFLMWGGQVVVCSTHNGVENEFNQQVQDILAGRSKYRHLRVDFDQALLDGLYQRICLVTGKPWSPEAEAAWRQDIIDFYRDSADEELFCVPSMGGGAYLSRALIEARMQADRPVIRWTPPPGFVDWPEKLRAVEVEAFCREQLKPLLDDLDPTLRSALGQDFGRSGDLSVIHPVQIQTNLVRITPFLLELRDVPFEAQKQILFYIIDRLPRFSHASLDATGNGAYLAEVARQKYGAALISEIKLSAAWYILNMPKLKAAFEDTTIILPADDYVATDYRAIQMTRGVAKVPDDARSDGPDGHERHGDAAIAGALAIHASGMDSGPVGISGSGQSETANDLDAFVTGGSDAPTPVRADLSAFLGSYR